MTDTTDKSQAKRCPGCGKPLAAGASFCRACGMRLDAATDKPKAKSARASGSERPQSPYEPAPPSSTSLSWTVLIAVIAVLLVGGGVAALALSNGDDSTSSSQGSAAAAGYEVPVGGESAESAAGEAEAEFPSSNRALMASEIQETLLAYHEDVVYRNFQEAWSLLSARKRAQAEGEDGYAAWAKNQATLLPYLSPAGLTVRIDGLEPGGVARVALSGMGWSDPQSPCSEWSGLTWAKYEREHWTYDPGYSTTPARRREWQPRSSELLGEGC
jgi:hypothetical protein